MASTAKDEDISLKTPLTMENAALIAQQLCGVHGTTLCRNVSDFPLLPITPLTHRVAVTRLASSPVETFAQTMVEGCEVAIILTIFEESLPVAIIVPTDHRLHRRQQDIDTVQVAVPQSSWRMAHAAFRGTVLYGVRYKECGIVLHDVAVSAGFTFVGSTKAPFSQRMEIVQECTHLLHTLLKSSGWTFHMAPFQACGLNKVMRVPAEGIKARGLWLAHQDSAVTAPRHQWMRHHEVHMMQYANKWFVAGEAGTMIRASEALPDVQPTVGTIGLDVINKVCPSSIGIFVPRIEHDVESGECRKFLVLTTLHHSHTFRNKEFGSWMHVVFNTNTCTQIEASFSALQVRLRWEILENYLLHGVGVPPEARPGRGSCDNLPPSHSCTFTSRPLFPPPQAAAALPLKNTEAGHGDSGSDSSGAAQERRRRYRKKQKQRRQRKRHRKENHHVGDTASDAPMSPRSCSPRPRKRRRRRRRRRRGGTAASDSASPH